MEDINIKIEESEVINSESSEKPAKSNTNWGKVSYYLFLTLAFLLPFWILPFGGLSLAISKSLLVYVLVLAAAIFYLIQVLQEGKIIYPKSIAFLALAVILLVTLLSALFSVSRPSSFFGIGSEVSTFSFLLILGIAAFMIVSLFRSEKSVLTFFFLFIVSSLIVFLVQIFSSVFGFSFGGLLPSKTDNLIGSWNELGIFFGFIGLISVIVLEFFGDNLAVLNSGRKWRVFIFFILGVSLLTMAIVNFTSVWIVFGLFLLVFLVYLFSSSGREKNLIRLPFFIILIALFFVLARPLVGDLSSSMGLDMLEVRPSWGATFSVVKETLSVGAKNTIIGSGPNTFVYDWIKFKPVEINETMFWNVRFQNGIGLLPSIIANTGILGILGWLTFLSMILYYGIRTVNYSENNTTKGLLFGSFIGSVYLWVFAIIYVPGNFLLTLAFLVTALFVAMLARAGLLEMKEFSFSGKSSISFVSSLVAVLLLIVSIAGFYLVFQKYVAVYSYVQGLRTFNTEADLDRAENLFLRAARFDKQDRYYRTLSETGLVRLSLLLQRDLPQEEARMQFQNILATTVQHAQTAVDINNIDPSNWMMLGEVYHNIVPFQIEGAREAALSAYSNALAVSPSDPSPFLSAAQVEVTSGNYEEAKSYLASALNIKRNYTSALFLLSQITAQEGDLESAIQQTEVARLTAPNDVGVLFQLGMLYYQNEDYSNAQSVFERIIVINPNYSNARYFLGLVYDMDGEEDLAIEQFEIIQSLNPDNTEVQQILFNLNAGRSALASISPPEPAPEEREEPPIDEEE
ncbi:tetratricopeptide repeat protein [Patescibacteria group bacterium]